MSPVKMRDRQRPRTHAEINDFRRRALMEGAIESMAVHGVAGTTVQTICTLAGASRGLIGHYYDSKEALMAEAFKHLFDDVAQQVRKRVEAQGGGPTARLKAMPAALFSPKVLTKTNRDAFLSFWHEVRFNDLVRKANKQLYVDYANRVEALFAEAAREQGVALDARKAALGLIGLSDGLWLGLSIHGQMISSHQAADMCLMFIESQFDAARSG
jgi:TetR/AcrR family transcriptional repressor of bet genes